MSGTGEARADFAGEERAFRIRLGEIRRIEERCGTGIGEVLRRLARATMLLAQVGGMEALASGLDIHGDDVREPIYQGLRGAGMADADATTLVRREIDDRGVQGLVDAAPTALRVLWGSQETPAKPEGETQAGESPAPRKNGSTSRASTASARRSASRPATPTS